MTWFDVPVLLDVDFRQLTGGTVVTLGLITVARFAPGSSAAAEACQCARNELNHLVEMLGGLERRREAPPHAARSKEIENAYAVLKLDDGARWPEVQSSYREICRRYHPDTLSGNNVPAHLVQLATAHFKEATDAYQLLKQELADRRS